MAYSIFKNKVSEQISDMCSDANQIFSNFIFGKAIDSILIGIICFIILSFTPLPYVLLISVIVGCTNMIPVFGPFIGAVPCALLILLSSGPKTMIYFCIFILILQQFDGNILGPKILGNRLGISAFWIMCSVVIGGGLFGVLGMVIAVPIFAFIHAEVKKYVTESLLKKGLPINSNNYVS
jgi:predicted PurR-regulated permease PerM